MRKTGFVISNKAIIISPVEPKLLLLPRPTERLEKNALKDPGSFYVNLSYILAQGPASTDLTGSKLMIFDRSLNQGIPRNPKT